MYAMLPEKAFRNTIDNEVPTARCGVNPSPKRRMGTIIHPPPAPISVPSAPIPVPAANNITRCNIF
jgi:hypothetical protein